MFKSGIIVRLIDVVLILLFGFISISEISRKSKIVLPKSTQTLPSQMDMESIMIIGITSEGKYLVNNETNIIQTLDELKEYIIENNKQDLLNKNLTRVRIRSNWNTPIRYTVALVNLCNELNIAKGIDVIRKTP